MAKSVLDIIIRTMKQGGADKETIKGLAGMKNAITSTMGAFAALAGVTVVLDKALEATVGKAVEYSNKVEGIANMTGQGAEASSRLIQVTDDLRVSYDDLSASVKKNADVTDFSIEGLAALSGEYMALGSQQEKQAFAQEHFGKQWGEFIKVLEAGPDKLRAMNDAVDENLVMTEKGMQAAKKYQENMDQLTDSWDAFTISAGNNAIPALNAVLENVNLNVAAQNNLDAALEQTGGNYRAANSLAYKMAQDEQAAADATLQHVDAMAQSGGAAADLAIDYEGLIGSITSMQSEMDRYNETQADANEAMATANADYAAGNIDLEQRNGILEENRQKLAENAAAHDEWAAQTVFAFAMARAAADGISEGEGEALIQIGEGLGLFDKKTAETMQSVNQSMSNIDVSNAQGTIDALTGQLEALTGHDWTITVTTQTVGSLPSSAPLQGGYATGGAFDAGSPMLVHKDEVMVPDYGGVVLTRTDAMRLMSGQGGGSDNSKKINIYGLTINAKGSVKDELDGLK